MEIQSGSSQKTGKRGEERVASLFYQSGHTVDRMPNTHPFDLLVDSIHRIEVKCSVFDGKRFTVNFHRHGVLNESNVDFYVLRLENVPGFKNAVHLLAKAPVGKLTRRMTLRSLLYLYSHEAVAFRNFKGVQKTREPAPVFRPGAGSVP